MSGEKMVRVRGRCVREDGRYRGVIAEGQSILWTREEQELEIPESAFLECQQDPTIVVVRIDSPPPAASKGKLPLATYATLADLLRYAPPGSIQDIDDRLQQQALDAFSAEVDTYLRDQYTLPLSEPYDPALVRHVCAGAIWQLMCFKGFNPEIGSNSVFEKNFERAVSWLKSLSRGEASLSISADSSSGRLGGARVASNPSRGWR